MTTDRNKGITSIAYNHINLPTRVVFENLDPQYSTTWKAITYTYDATGVKLQKTVQQGTIGSYSTTHTKYATHYIYVEDATGETLTFFNHPEGYVEPNTGNDYDYVYQYKDHLGNIRLSYKDNNGSLEIVEENNYYPFGLKHKGYNNGIVGVDNNYMDFQGQELTEDLGLNVHEWKYRISDPAIGRFWQIDPLAEDYVHNGTYNFSENRVIDGVELEGLEVVLVNKEKDPVIHSSGSKIKGNDKMVTVVAHGNPKLMVDDSRGVNITSGSGLDKVLNRESDVWKNRESNEGMTVVLYSCRVGCDVADKDGTITGESFAQRISASDEFKDVEIIAPDERTWFSSEEVVGTYEASKQHPNGQYKYKRDADGKIIRDADGKPIRKDGSRSDKPGNWRVFKNGEEIKSYKGNWTPTNSPSLWDNLTKKNDD